MSILEGYKLQSSCFLCKRYRNKSSIFPYDVSYCISAINHNFLLKVKKLDKGKNFLRILIFFILKKCHLLLCFSWRQYGCKSYSIIKHFILNWYYILMDSKICIPIHFLWQNSFSFPSFSSSFFSSSSALAFTTERSRNLENGV